MKKILLTAIILFCIKANYAQNTWTQKANFGGTAREYTTGFSIGSKGYIGTGKDNNLNVLKNDFWEYNPATNVWTQKADFGGTARYGATGFGIGGKGYIGLGYDGSIGSRFRNDFWEYDTATNAWTEKANFGGAATFAITGFSIGSKGYIGLGYDGDYTATNNFWEYDPATNAWTQKANFGGGATYYATGFSIGSKGYIGTGRNALGFNKNDFWEYNPATNAWTQKANFLGTARFNTTGFSIGSKGYIGTGFDDIDLKNDFWEYNPATNAWTQKTNFGGSPRYEAIGFSIGNKGYIGTGLDKSDLKNDFWEYTPDDNSISTNISPTSFCSGSSLTVSFIATGTYNAGNIFTAQLSNASGSFASPVNIGSVSATASGTINAAIPSNTTAGSGYRIRVVSDNPAITGSDNGTNIAITATSTFYRDADDDGYSDGTTTTQCAKPTGYKLASELTATSGDCDDNNATINPATKWYKDADDDDYSDGTTATQCTKTTGYKLASALTAITGDCNDGDATINLNTKWYKDADNDGYSDGTTATQCEKPANYKLASELISTSGDCNDGDATINPQTKWYKDADNDGYSDGTIATQCVKPTGYKPASGLTAITGDCNDGDATVHSPQIYYLDFDKDGYGNPAKATSGCSSTPPPGYVSNNKDCNDSDPAISPVAVEVCGNRVDDNCNNVVDEKTCYACQNATNLKTANITSNSAQLNWSATANPQQWQLEYKSTARGAKWIDVFLTGNIRSVKISGLAAKQAYNWQIHAKCSGKWTGYSGTISFTTSGNGLIAQSSSVASVANNSTIRLYPNPTKGQFVIELHLANNISTNAKIQLTNMMEQTVSAENATISNGVLQKRVTISSSLAQGIYMVKVIANNKTYLTKLVYEK
jgi:hypothetical protein